MSSPPVYHEVQTPKKEVKEAKDIPKSPLSNPPTCDPPLSSTSTPKKDSPKRPAGGINYLDALRALPEVRSIPWMPGKELAPDKSTESPRTQTKSAFLLSTRGVIREPCNHCKSGVGRFLYCITLEGWFHGACATCQMGTRGNLCSLRSDGGGDKNKQQLTNLQSTDIQSPTIQLSKENIPLALEPKKPNPKRKRQSTKSDSPATNLTSNAPLGPPTILSTISPAIPTAYSSPYATMQSSKSNPEQPHHPVQHWQNIAPTHRHTHPSTINYIYKRPLVPSGASNPAHGENLVPIQSAPYANKSTEFQTHRPSTDGSLGRNVHITSQPIKPVNRDVSTSLSPSEQLLGSARPLPNQGPPVEHSHMPQQLHKIQQQRQQQQFFQSPSQESNMQVNGGAVPEPETLPSILSLLPEKKQKLIHGLVKDLQGGIKRAKEQADTMQQQLDQLQTAIGISPRLDVAN